MRLINKDLGNNKEKGKTLEFTLDYNKSAHSVSISEYEKEVLRAD